MTKDQEIKKSESESTMVEDTTGSYATMLQDENRRIVVHFHISIPSPGTANAPWFDSRDATLFIERFYQMCKDHEVIDPKNIIKQLARYCVTWIGEWIKTLEDYKKDNLEVFSKEIIYEFHNQNITYKIHHQNYLQAITKKPHAWDSNICTYVQEYTTITIETSKKTASSAKTEESESKFKAKSPESTNIEAVIKKMTNRFTNLTLVMRVQSNQIQGNSNQYYMLQREEPSKPIPNYTTNVTTNSATVQENTQPQLVNSYMA
ncbi:uncharacterized protein CIMG_13658 [Coccidioides immitis RS]|uniref:Uncharacterized protein n=1 Tax=Coccidioides immitis (strain RS) TaxID=246410 RepID=J3KAA9_COCIM|nr:uncharacterized protein CIMG_13658 [Coccidioides immitis RS]EAS31941.3 hypothetical protein CIMG_13658 [Coccidioides immitis RS]